MENKGKEQFIHHMSKQENLYPGFMVILLNQKIYSIRANRDTKLMSMKKMRL